MTNRISCQNINLSYGQKIIIKNLTIDFPTQGLFTLLGANGTGKSTLLKAFIQDPMVKKEGEIYINNELISHKNISTHIAFLPQSLQVNLSYSALEVVMMGHRYYTYFIPDKKEIKKQARENMEKLNISHLENRDIQTLSGGERSLVFLAKALCKNTDILILDEPDSALDFSNRLLLFDYLEQLKTSKLIIMTSHDPTTVLRYCDYIIPIYEDSSYEYILKNNIDVEIIKKIYPKLQNHAISIEPVNGYKYLSF